MAGALATGAREARSQETVTLRDGQTQQGAILGVTDQGIKLRTANGIMVEPFANVTQVDMRPPQAYMEALSGYENGDLRKALASIQEVARNYRGLPTTWARSAMLTLGDIYVGLNQLPDAEAAYSDYQRAYPATGAASVNVGMALIDVSRKNYAAAKEKIAPILDQALKEAAPSKDDAALFGRAFYVSGQMKEQTGDFTGALEDYLRTVAIFPQDRVAATGAQERADALRKEHGVSVP